MNNKYTINDLPKLIADITIELGHLTKFLFLAKNNINLYIANISKNLDFIRWLNKSIELRTKETPNVVKQKEIFYCELGINIGSEQGLKRPVVVLQNDIGNSRGDTTIVAPITTYEHKDIVEKNGKKFIKTSDKDGNEVLKLIDFYEVPVELEKGYTQEIIGFINIVHMREVSKKRLSKVPVAKITNDNLLSVQNAIIRNLDIKLTVDKSV